MSFFYNLKLNRNYDASIADNSKRNFENAENYLLLNENSILKHLSKKKDKKTTGIDENNLKILFNNLNSVNSNKCK